MRNDRQTRRNLLAAASLVVTALWSRGVRAGRGHENDGGGARAYCFLRGTLIQTPSGEREISTLQVGDLVVTQSGHEEPIKWIGRCHLRRDAGIPWRADVAPIKVTCSAL